jgi:hypothetical protein
MPAMEKFRINLQLLVDLNPVFKDFQEIIQATNQITTAGDKHEHKKIFGSHSGCKER